MKIRNSHPPKKSITTRSTPRRGRRLGCERLEPRHLLAADPIISEFMASNGDTLDDGFGDSSDWIEIHNAGDESVDLFGYHLTDSADEPAKWRFDESVVIESGGFLVVFASGGGVPDPEGNLHTNFKLKAGGEYIALSDPSETLLSEISENGVDYPAQFSDISYGTSDSGIGFLATPTPGAANAELFVPGPLISNVQSFPETAIPGQPIVVTAEIQPLLNVVDSTSVLLTYRQNYDAEIAIGMRDDGLGDDAVAGDNIFTATIPGSAVAAGELVRWLVTASDLSDNESRLPRFLDRLDSPEYFGTVAPDPAASTDLPVIYWFVERPQLAESTRGTRGSLFFRGEFYDNIQTDLHGQSTAGSDFVKKSFDFDANAGEKFDVVDGIGKVSDFNLLTNYGDQTKLRQTLGYELHREAGVAAGLAFPVAVHRNGSFLGLYDFVEESDEEQLERLGLDPENNYYKVNNNLVSAWTNVEQKAGIDESRDDLVEVINANRLSTRRGRTWDWDNLDMADTVNYFAVNYMIRNQDFGNKNMYWYHDVSGTGLWSILPWDVDLSFGHNWTADVSPPYFDNTLYTNGGLNAGWNSLMQRLVTSDPNFREMLNRRMRTLMDQFYGAAGTSTDDSFLGQRIEAQRALLQDEIAADIDEWGIQSNFGSAYPFNPEQAIDQLLEVFLPARRDFLEGVSTIPDAHGVASDLRIGHIEFAPPSGVAEQYVVIENHESFAVDISGWQMDGAISHTFKPGTVVPAGGELYLTGDVQGFLGRVATPHGGQQHFVQGAASGTFSERGGVLRLTNGLGSSIDSSLYGMSADISGDGLLSCHDLDAVSNVASLDVYVDQFDINADGDLNAADVDAWLEQASIYNLEPGEQYQPGDGNLDGRVDDADFDIWNTHRFTATRQYCNGDYNVDGIADVSDFNLWNANRSEIVEGAAATAESDVSTRIARRTPRAAPTPVVVDVSQDGNNTLSVVADQTVHPANETESVGTTIESSNESESALTKLVADRFVPPKVADENRKIRIATIGDDNAKNTLQDEDEKHADPLSPMSHLFRWVFDV